MQDTKFIDVEEIRNNLGWKDTVEALRQMFAEGCEAPERHHHNMKVPNGQDATMLLMPAWLPGRYSGLKLVNVFPDNYKKELPTIMGSYLLMDGATGGLVVAMDAGELTARRTAAASALASDYLSRKDADKLLIVGSGRLAHYLGLAHDAVRPLKEIQVWARNSAKARDVAQTYRDAGYNASAISDLEKASGQADIISCATMSTSPLILGKWLQPGTHVDLIGSFKPTMRETDDAVISGAEVFVDTRAGVLAEAGDIVVPMANGVFTADDLVADLSELAAGIHPGRKQRGEITVFKSVGAALEDLAAAILCYETWAKKL